MFFKKKEKMMGNYVVYSQRTAEVNPHMIQREYATKLTEIEEAINNYIKSAFIFSFYSRTKEECDAPKNSSELLKKLKKGEKLEIDLGKNDYDGYMDSWEFERKTTLEMHSDGQFCLTFNSLFLLSFIKKHPDKIEVLHQKIKRKEAIEKEKQEFTTKYIKGQ